MNTKEKIIEKSKELFLSKGYDDTSITNILKECEIGKGTLYYYFVSKEAILDEVVISMNNEILKTAEEILEKDMDIYEKLVLIMASLNVQKNDDGFLKSIHEPQNALFKEKSNKHLIIRLTDIMYEVVVDGIKENIFSTNYPKETCEMIIIYALNVFDYKEESNIEENMESMNAFIFNMCRLLGDESLELKKSIKRILNMGQGNNE